MCRIQNTCYKTALSVHLKVQGPQHMLQNCPIRAPECPGSPTHATKLPYPYTWTSVIPNIPQNWPTHPPESPGSPTHPYKIAQPIHLHVQDPEHILRNCPIHAPEHPVTPTHPTELPYPYTWKSKVLNTSCTIAIPYTWKSRAPNTPYIPALPIHLKVQGPQHTLYTSPTHTPESPESWTRPTHQPYPYTCKSRVPNTSYTRSKILKVRGPEHILHNCPTHTPERQWPWTYPTQPPYPCAWKSKVSNTSYRTALPIHLEVQGPEHILQNCPTHPPGSPGSSTHPIELPYPSTWKSKVLNTSCTISIPMHLKV